MVALSGDSDGLRPAVVAGIVEIHDDRLRFSHPLLAAAALEAVDPLHRQALLRRLAAAVPDEDERARLLALASDGPDPAVAMALDHAATRAHDRGAIGVAAELCEQARRLTPAKDGGQRDRRTLDAARYQWEAGDMERARALLETAVAGAASSVARAEALVELAWVHVVGGDQPGGTALARRALGDMALDSAIRPHALNCVATALGFMLEDLDEAARLSHEAVELAERRGDVVALSENLCGIGYVASLLGRPEWDAVLERAEALGPEAHGWRIVGWPIIHRAIVSLWTDRPDEAVAIYHRLRYEALDRGDEGSVPPILAYQAIGEYSAGAWPEAEVTATLACEAATQGGEVPHEAMALSARAMVRACTGRTDEARVDAERALSLAGDRSVALARIHAARALALLDLEQGRPGDAADRLGALRVRLAAAGVGEPAAIPFAADEVEALVAAGRVTVAEHVVEWLEERGQALDRASALAAAWRGRGLLAAASGAQEVAIEAFAAAVEQSARVAMPFERGRALLQLGAAQRRAKRKREARATLEEATRGFDALGAAPWSRRAGDELARISGRRRGDPGLTATERQIAELVAAGRTNKEVAAALFLSRRTVEAHLRQVFRKLGVRSRTELARQALDAPASQAKVQGFHRFEPAGPEVPSAVDAVAPPPAGWTSRPGA
jgi:DNA-binding CsgD family transcriptional regulator